MDKGSVIKMVLVGFAPFSWTCGVLVRPGKRIYAFGPLRLVIWNNLKPWGSYSA